MPWQPSNEPKVSLYGVSRNALYIGRACALKDSPVLGIYDPDPQKALRAALFLGVSARSTPESFLADKPNIVISSLPGSEALSGEHLVIRFGRPDEDAAADQVCWADCLNSEDFPEQITSEPPQMEISLCGSERAVATGRAFFDWLRGRFIIHP